MSKELKRRLNRIKEDKPFKVAVAPEGVDKETYKLENFPDEPDVVVLSWLDGQL